MWRWMKWFLFFWCVLIVVSFFTVKKEMSMSNRLGAAAMVASVAQLVVTGGEGSSRRKRSCRPCIELLIHPPLDSAIIYRIKDQKIFTGWDEMPLYEIEGNWIYPWAHPDPAFRIERNKVYRGLEKTPAFEVRGDRIYHIPSGKVIYEMEALW